MTFGMQSFLLLILLSHVTSVTAVAGCLSDTDKDDRPRKNCTAAGFSDIPAGLELTTKVLLFPLNQFSSLSWSSFQTFTEIYEIDFTGNKIPEVTPSEAPVLPSLSVLRLGSNRLTSLPAGGFTACPALTDLYLHNNAISSLSDGSFSSLSKLEILDLSSNHIRVLPPLMLHPLRAIETLYIENNKIKVMPDGWFSQKEEVPYLYLSANPWACSCSVGYLRRYLEDYDYNVYTRDGVDIQVDGESVVCDSPPPLKGKPVVTLEESDYCASEEDGGPAGDFEDLMTTFVPAPPPLPTTIPTIITTTTAADTTTITPPPPPAPSTPAPSTPAPPLPVDGVTSSDLLLYSVPDVVVTWSWFHSFTRLVEWSHDSGTEVRGEGSWSGSSGWLATTNPPAAETTTIIITTPSTTTAPPSTTTIRAEEEPAGTTGATIPITTTRKPQVATTTAAAMVTPKLIPIPPPEPFDPTGRHAEVGVGRAGHYCTWLFAGCTLLCAASAACMLVTLARFIMWYRGTYRPLRTALKGRAAGRRGRGEEKDGEGVRLATFSAAGEQEVGVAAGGGRGVMTLYRSVLFVSTEGGEMKGEQGGGGGVGEGGVGEGEGCLVMLQPAGGAADKVQKEGEESGGSEGGGEGGGGGVYRKALYRLFSRQEDLDEWRDVMEECRVTTEDGGKRGEDRGGGGAGGVSRKRYSLILREEREEVRGGREELDWVVGGWEVGGRRGRGGEEEGEEQRSSWGEWLAGYLPSMPWGVATPPEPGTVE